MPLRAFALTCLAAVLASTTTPTTAVAEETSSKNTSYDLVIYGGTSAAVSAAVQAKRMDLSVVIVCPDKHLGGLSSGGLGWTDTGNKAVIGGVAREFYQRVWKHYDSTDAWKWQTSDEYGNRGQGTPAIDGKQRTMWIFEPHVAELVFDSFVREYEIPVYRDEWLDRASGVTKERGKIRSIRMLSGKVFSGRMFIDATYEGDLMAAAGVDYHVGREASAKYDEAWNGVQTGVLHHSHHFGVLKTAIDPYVKVGQPDSGLLPRISPDPPGTYRDGDHRIQAYCFRMCLTNHAPNRVPFPRPESYDASEYELLLRVFNAGWRETFRKFDPIPNHKTDTNNHGPFSTDNIGRNYDYPEASYERRAEIIREHEQYQKGLMYFIANDPRVPEDVRSKMSTWGLARDEFVDNGHWPHQLYVREARRMVGQYVMTENELLKRRVTPDSIGMGSYTMDSHNVQRYVTPEGHVQNEGDIGVSTRGPYEIALGSILPKRDQCENLLVPVCVSSSHIAFGSIRMEPVFMILGQSAATTAALAIQSQRPVQLVPYSTVQKRLLADGQILKSDVKGSAKGPVDPRSLKGIVIDSGDAKLVGKWMTSTSTGKFVGAGYLHDGNPETKEASAEFSAKIPESGRYEVRLAYSYNPNRSSKVTVTVRGDDASTQLIDQRKKPAIDGLFVSLGKFELKQGQTSSVVVENRGSNGHVIVDAVQWIRFDN